MGGVAFVSLDDSAYPEWQVRVDSIVAFRPGDGGGVEVLTSAGKVVSGNVSVSVLMAKIQRALAVLDADDGA